MDEHPVRHEVAACGEAFMKVPVAELMSASYSTLDSVDDIAVFAKPALGNLKGNSRSHVKIN